MGEYGDLYAAGRQRLSAYVGGLDEAQLATPVPATPGWDVKAVVSHMTGIMADLAAGDFDKAADADRQAEERRGTAMAAILEEWAVSAPGIEAGLDEFPFAVGAGPLVGDLAVHEGDIRLALGDAPVDEAATLRAGLRYYGGKLEGRIGEGGLPSLRVLHDGTDHVLGEGEPQATVTAAGQDLLRSLAGRRTVQQVEALDWSGDAAPYVAVFSEYGWPETAIE